LKSGEEIRQFFNIAGESIPKKLIQSDRRSISTFEEVNLSQEEAQSGKWRIILDIETVNAPHYPPTGKELGK
jgi:hypothetical protein